MKKRIGIIVCCIILSIAFVLFACQSKMQLSAPSNLSVVSNVLEWETVSNASGYEINIEDAVFFTNKNYYSLESLLPGNYLIKVRCKGAGKFLDSEYSDTILYTKKDSSDISNLERLPTPAISMINGEGLMQWQSIEGASGYRIYVNNISTYVVSDGKAFSYTLGLNKEGSYNIQLQAIGVSGQSLDSQMSKMYGFVVEADGTPRLPSLAKPELRYNYELKAIEWQHNKLAQGYSIWVDGKIINNAEIVDLENSKSYMLNLTKKGTVYAIKAIGDGITFGDSSLSNSIQFPFEKITPPEDVKIEVIQKNGSDCFALAWERVNYSDGYLISINGVEHELDDAYYDFSSFEDGEYVVKVKSKGDGTYYKSSPYSEEMLIKILDSKLFRRVQTPTNLGYAGRLMIWDMIDEAQSYTIKLTNLVTGLTEEIEVNTNEHTFEDLELVDTLIATVKANGKEPFADSLWSDELVIFLDIHYSHLNRPLNITYTNDGLRWLEVENADGYLLVIDDEEITLPTAHYSNLLSSGSYIVKVKSLSFDPSINDSIFSIVQITVPILLDTPNINLVGDVVYYNKITNADSYTVFCNDEILAQNIYVLEFNLQSAINDDGEYYISVIAAGKGVYTDSLRSKEVLYVKTDAVGGTETKPIVINSVEEFLQIKNAPNAYYTINATQLDFAINGTKMALLPMFDQKYPFRGVIYGNGCVIKNIEISEDDGVSGIFGVLNGAYIESLMISGISIAGNINSQNIGIIASNIYDSTLNYINIAANMDILANNANIGIIAGYMSGSIINCHAAMDIKVTGDNNSIGGLIGVMYGAVNNCSITKNGVDKGITATGNNLHVGGFTAVLQQENVNVAKIAVDANITVMGYNAIIGGVLAIGDFESLTNSSYAGSISNAGAGTVYIGAIAGQLNASVDNLTISGIINSDTDTVYIGGISSISNNTVQNIVLDISIKSIATDSYIGGAFAAGTTNFVENVNGSIEIDAKADDLKAGGLSADITGDVTSCNLSIALTLQGSGQSGGLIAHHIGNIEGIEVQVAIVALGQIDVGGIAGVIEGDITNVVISGEIQTRGDNVVIGGIAAISYGNFENIKTESAQRILLDALGQDVTLGGISGLHSGNIEAKITNVITALGSGQIAGAVAEASGLFYIDIDTKICSDFAVVGGVFANLQGGYDGKAKSDITARGAVTLGGIAAISDANIHATADIIIAVEEGDAVVVGGISAVDNGEIQAEVNFDIQVEASGGDVAGGIAFGYGEYAIIAVGNILYQSRVEENHLRVGGLAGYASSIINSSYEGEVDVNAINAHVGGISAVADSVIATNAKANITIKAVEVVAGIIAGQVGYANDCNPNQSKLEISANNAVVGIFGIADTVSNMSIDDIAVDIQALSVSYGVIAGGIAFADNITVGNSNMPVVIDILAETAFVGGIAGDMDTDGLLSNVYSFVQIDVTAQLAYVGGLVGKGGSITQSLSHAELSFEGEEGIIGGIAGELVAANTTYFAGSIFATAQQAVLGGFVGRGQLDVADCYVNANINAQLELGEVGLFGGSIQGHIIATYATGQVISNMATSGYSNATLEYAYTDILTSIDSQRGIVANLGYAREELDGFGNNWTLIDDCYPILAPLVEIDGQINTNVEWTILDSVEVDGDTKISDILPTTIEEQFFGRVTWSIADTQKAKLIGDTLYFYENGEVLLKGSVSGGQTAYTVTINAESSNIMGAGTEANPYIIDSVKWLPYLYEYRFAYFELAADLDLTYYNFLPIGEEELPFCGTVYANNHIISNVRVNKAATIYSGFFGVLDGASISNLRIENITINYQSADFAGLFAGKVIGSTLDNITVSGDIGLHNSLALGGAIGSVEDSVINGLGYSGNLIINRSDYSGGVIGYAKNSQLERMYSNAKVTIINETNYGGVIGFVDTMTVVKNSYAATKVNSVDDASVAGFVYENSGEVLDSYALMQSNIVYSGFAVYNMTGLTNCYVVLPPFVYSHSVEVGSSEGLTEVGLTTATQNLFGENSSWAMVNDMLPRLDNLLGQSDIATPIINSDIIFIEDADVVDLYHYITIDADVFGIAEAVSSDSEKLYFDDNGYALITANTVFGDLHITLLFEGGYQVVVWVVVNNTVNPDFSSGYGTQLSPFIITQASHFANISKYPYAYFALGADIVLDDYEYGDFSGQLLGNGYTITTQTTLFSTATGSIKDVKIVADITSNDKAYSAVVADTAISLVVTDLVLSYNIAVSSVDYVGGVVGYGNGVNISNLTLDECTINAENTLYIGGVVGYLYSEYIENIISFVTGGIDIVSDQQRGYVGGIAGEIEGVIRNIELYATLLINTIGDIYAGGIAGSATICENVFLQVDLQLSAIEAGICVGGAAGACDNISNVHITFSNVVLYVVIDGYYYDEESSVIVYIGGMFGIAYNANYVSITESVLEVELKTTQFLTDKEELMAMVGGVAGYVGSLANAYSAVELYFDISGNTLSQESELTSYAGGAAGHLSDAVNISIEGVIAVDAKGGAKVYAGGISGLFFGDYSEYTLLTFVVSNAEYLVTADSLSFAFVGSLGGKNSALFVEDDEGHNSYIFVHCYYNSTLFEGGMFGEGEHDEATLFEVMGMLGIDIINPLLYPEKVLVFEQDDECFYIDAWSSDYWVITGERIPYINGGAYED